MSTAELAKNACVPCKGGVPPLKGEALEAMHEGLGSEWELIKEHHLVKVYSFKGYSPAVAKRTERLQLLLRRTHLKSGQVFLQSSANG